MGAPEEIAVDVIGDAGRFDVIGQILIEAMMTGASAPCRLFRAESKNGSFAILKIRLQV